jgi:membrane protein implicated in regulation of membrane protease activity
MEPWHVWLIAALALLISEMASGDFWLTCLAVGCIAAAGVGVLSLGLPLQIIAFAGGTLLSLLGLRPALRRRLRIGHDVVRTNVDALPGKVGTVTVRIGGGGAAGRALVEGEDWRVTSSDDMPIEAGTRVMVLQVDGSTLVVEKEE